MFFTWPAKFLCSPKEHIESVRKITTLQNEYNTTSIKNLICINIIFVSITFKDEICKECEQKSNSHLDVSLRVTSSYDKPDLSRTVKNIINLKLVFNHCKVNDKIEY